MPKAVFEISGPGRRNFRPKSARPGPGEFSARVGPARPGPEEFSAQVGPARPGRIFGPGRPGPEEFSAQVGPARPGGIFGPSRPGPARPGEIFGQVGPARPGGIFRPSRPGPARPGAKWPRFQTLTMRTAKNFWTKLWDITFTSHIVSSAKHLGVNRPFLRVLNYFGSACIGQGTLLFCHFFLQPNHNEPT